MGVVKMIETVLTTVIHTQPCALAPDDTRTRTQWKTHSVIRVQGVQQ